MNSVEGAGFLAVSLGGLYYRNCLSCVPAFADSSLHFRFSSPFPTLSSLSLSVPHFCHVYKNLARIFLPFFSSHVNALGGPNFVLVLNACLAARQQE